MRETSAKFHLYAGNVHYNIKIEELMRIRIIICILLPPIIIEKKLLKIQFTTKRSMSLFVAHLYKMA
jgi:hypothetical protein